MNPVHYQRLNDAENLGGDARRSVEEVAQILKELNADFVMQGLSHYSPCVDTCSRWSSLRKQEKCEKMGYAYDLMAEAVDTVKSETGAKIGGAALIQFFWAEQWDSEVEFNRWLTRDDTWELALDPSSFGLPVSKEEFQKWFWKQFKGVDITDPKNEMGFYLFDPTLSDVQNIFADLLEAQLNCGVDAFWWDMLLLPVSALLHYGVPVEHTAIQEIYEGCKEIASFTKKKVTHIMWSYWRLEYDYGLFSEYGAPPVDICLDLIGTEEISSQVMNEDRWNTIQQYVQNIYGNLPHFTRLDFGSGRTGLYVFAEELTVEEANEFLTIAEDFFQQRGILLILPVHGGNPCDPSQISQNLCPKLAYGQYNWYDSLAPEFDTYDTIKSICSQRTTTPSPTPTPTPPPICNYIRSIGGVSAIDSVVIQQLILAYNGIISFSFTPSKDDIRGCAEYYKGNLSEGDRLTGCSFAGFLKVWQLLMRTGRRA